PPRKVVAGIGRDGTIKRRQGLLDMALRRQQGSEVVLREGILRLKGDSSAIRCLGLGMLALSFKYVPQIAIRAAVRWRREEGIAQASLRQAEAVRLGKRVNGQPGLRPRGEFCQPGPAKEMAGLLRQQTLQDQVCHGSFPQKNLS